MESRANYALVGLFTLAVLAAAFGFVYWFNSGGGQAKQQVNVVFTGSVTGLGRGSSVLFNGLRVGEVTAIGLDPTDPRRIISVISVDGTTPVKTDTKARIEAQGLAGVVAVQLIGGRADAENLQPPPGRQFPLIAADRSEFQDLLETIRQIANRTNSIFDGLEGIVKTNAQPINDTIANVNRFSRALGDNAEGVGKLMASFGQIADTIGPLSQRLGVLSEELTLVVRAIDQNKITNTLDNIERFTGALADPAGDISRTAREIAAVSEKLNAAVDGQKLAAIVSDLQGFSSALGGSGAQVANAVRDMAAVSDRVNRALDGQKLASTLDNIEKFTSSLGNSGEDVARTAREAAALTQKLSTAIDPTQLSNTLNNIDRFVAVLGSSGEQVGNAVRDMAAVSDRVNRALDGQKLASTLDNIEKFSAALGGSSGEVGRAVNNVASITDKLNSAADQIEGVLKAASGFLNSATGEEGKGAFTEIAEAARSIRVLADNLDKRTAEITAGITRFTGPGLRDLETLAADGKRTLNDVARTLRNLERNPQQFIFGSRPSLPQYGGSR